MFGSSQRSTANFVSGKITRPLTAAVVALCFNTFALAEMPKADSLDASIAIVKRTSPAPTPKRSIQERMKADPLAFMKQAKENFEQAVSNYTCTFTKKEVIQGKMSKAQQMAVKCRHKPFSVAMEWTKNPGPARKVLFVDGERVGNKGEQYALIQPEGWLARWVVKSVQRDIHGKDAREYARRTIDQFGFANTFHLIIQYCEIAKQHGELKLRYVGESRAVGRKTYKFERVLPYAGPKGIYPDALLVIHLDQEWLVPTKCVSYADRKGRKLLGSYTLSNVDLNAGLTAADFSPDKLGY